MKVFQYWLAWRSARQALTFCTLFFGLVVVPGALAQCGAPPHAVKPTAWDGQLGGVHLTRTALDTDTAVPSIVGMWHVVFTATTSNGNPIPDTVIDNALVVWHSDHTEIMNSVRPPQDGNFCLGVWEQTAPYKYYLNHFAWFANAYPNNSGGGIGTPVGPTHFEETVTLAADGNSFSGVFKLFLHDTTGKLLLQSFTGVLKATRITTSTTFGDLL